MESGFICISLFLASLRPICYYTYSDVTKTYFSQIYLIYFLIYFTSVLEMSAILTQITASLTYYLMITNTNIFLIYISSKKVTLVIFIFSILIYLYQCFQFDINAKYVTINNVTQTYYVMEPNSFFDSEIKKIIEIVAFIIRDGINSLILIVMNILIFLNIKRYSKNKNSLFKNKYQNERSIQDETTKEISNFSLKKISMKVAIMVWMTCLNCLFGRIPILVSYIYRNISSDFYALYLIDRIAVLTVYVSYALYFFIYLTSNKKFKDTVFKLCTDPLKRN